MRLSKCIILCLILTCLFSCDKDMISSDYPRVATSEVVIQDGKYIFTGELESEKKLSPDELGFIWQVTDDPVQSKGFSTKLQGNDSFQAIITNSIKKGARYYLRAYAKCGSTTIFGEKVSFTANLDMPLILLKFEPLVGSHGDTIRLTGKGFNQDLDNNSVFFNNANARIISGNDSVLICIVPQQITGGLKSVKVITDGIEGVYQEKFDHYIPPIPEIVSVSENHVKYGSILTLYTRNIEDAIFVQLIGSAASYLLTPSFVSADSIKVEIYNQENPYQLLNLSTFKVKICMPNESVLYEPDLTLVSGWSRISDFPGGGRYKAASFYLDGKLYTGGGAGNGAAFSDFWEYNPVTKIWGRKSDIPGGPRSYPRAFTDGISGYMGAGFSGDNSYKTQLYSFYKYNPQTNGWSQIPDYPDNISNFYLGYTASVNGRVFASLSNNSVNLRELVNDAWISHQSISDLVDCPAAGILTIGKKFYVIAGYRINNTVNNAVWEYDTRTETWTRKSDFPGEARWAAAFFQVGEYGYYGCGMSLQYHLYNDMWRYDSLNDKWIRVSDFPGGYRSHLTSTSNGFTGFAGLGYDGGYRKDFWRFDP